MDNFGGIFTTLSQTCKKFHCLKNGQCVDSWENDCLRQKDADSVGCLFNPSFVRGRCPRTARLEVFWGILMTAKHSGSAGGPPPDFFDDPAFAASLYAEADRRAGGADRSARSSRETRDGRSKARQATVQNFSTVQPSKRVPAFAKPNQPYSGMPPVSWSDADLELKPRIEPIAKRSSTRAAWGPQTVDSAASGVESSPAAAPRRLRASLTASGLPVKLQKFPCRVWDTFIFHSRMRLHCFLAPCFAVHWDEVRYFKRATV